MDAQLKVITNSSEMNATLLESSKELKPSKSYSNIQKSNQELWNALRNGHQYAIEKLFKDNYQVLFSYARKICKDTELSKDCVQELFVGLWDKCHTLNEVTNVRSYLLQSIWYLVIKKLKKQSKQVPLDENDDYNLDIVFSNESILIDKQNHKEKGQQLLTALDSLTKRQKQIIFMLYYEGLTISEIQQITDLKYQSIKNLTHRAMLTLREYYNVVKS